jgi:hypothetical protein
VESADAVPVGDWRPRAPVTLTELLEGLDGNKAMSTSCAATATSNGAYRRDAIALPAFLREPAIFPRAIPAQALLREPDVVRYNLL